MKSSNKLIHIIPTLQNGGAETVLTRLIEEFHYMNVIQYVFTINGKDTDFHYSHVVQFCEVIQFKNNPKKAYEILKEYPEAIFLSWMYKSIVFGYWLKFKYNISNPIIWNIRNSNFRFFQLYQKSGLFFFGLLSRLLNAKIIYCSFKSKKVHEKYFFKIKKSTVIQNRLAKKIISNNNLPENYILFVGRHHQQKGIKRLLSISNNFLKINKNFKLIIAGYGWKLDYFPFSIREKIVLLENVINVFNLYKKSKCLLFTSVSGEGYPNVLPEAMVCGTPIVAFEAGDSKLILENYKFGKIVKTESDFINQLQKIIDNPFQKKKIELEIKKQKSLLDFKKTVMEYKEFIF